MSTNSRSAVQAALPSATRALYEPALVDWIVLTYLAIEIFSVWSGKHGAARDHFLTYLGALFVGYGGIVIAYRALAPTGWFWQRLYRFAPMVAACAVYFRLREIFPLVNPRQYDASLHALDMSLFGTDLSVWIEQFTSRGVVNWFSFFYWLYFPTQLAGILWSIFVSREPDRRARFAVGSIMAFLVGHIIYTMVPGLGPWHHLAAQYDGPLQGGWFFQANWRTYRTGAGHDIFPSLHTACSVWLCLFLNAERRTSRVARWLYWPVVFISANIVAATIVLRWHYFVDLVAGTMLGFLCNFAAYRALSMYEDRRRRHGIAPTYW
jgi:membrane-associated phospholipid phosphatase